MMLQTQVGTSLLEVIIVLVILGCLTLIFMPTEPPQPIPLVTGPTAPDTTVPLSATPIFPHSYCNAVKGCTSIEDRFSVAQK